MYTTLLAMQIVPLALLGVPVLLIALSVPLILEKIPRNYWYGFRMPKTMSSDEMWYSSNKVAGKYLLGAAIVQFVGLAIVAWVAQDPDAAGVWSMAVLLVPLFTSVVMSYLKVRKF